MNFLSSVIIARNPEKDLQRSFKRNIVEELAKASEVLVVLALQYFCRGDKKVDALTNIVFGYFYGWQGHICCFLTILSRMFSGNQDGIRDHGDITR